MFEKKTGERDRERERERQTERERVVRVTVGLLVVPPSTTQLKNKIKNENELPEMRKLQKALIAGHNGAIGYILELPISL